MQKKRWCINLILKGSGLVEKSLDNHFFFSAQLNIVDFFIGWYLAISLFCEIILLQYVVKKKKTEKNNFEHISSFCCYNCYKVSICQESNFFVSSLDWLTLGLGPLKRVFFPLHVATQTSLYSWRNLTLYFIIFWKFL